MSKYKTEILVKTDLFFVFSSIACECKPAERVHCWFTLLLGEPCLHKNGSGTVGEKWINIHREINGEGVFGDYFRHSMSLCGSSLDKPSVFPCPVVLKRRPLPEQSSNWWDAVMGVVLCPLKTGVQNVWGMLTELYHNNCFSENIINCSIQ